MPTKTKPGETMTITDLFTWTQASIFGDIANGKVAQATQVRRNLQRRYATMLGMLAVKPVPGVPYDAQALARYELVALDHSVNVAMARARPGRVDARAPGRICTTTFPAACTRKGSSPTKERERARHHSNEVSAATKSS